jgi:hypothetical protein
LVTRSVFTSKPQEKACAPALVSTCTAVVATNRLASATTLEEHDAALAGFDEDLSLDTPFVQVTGRDRVRFLAALTKYFLGTFEIEPRVRVGAACCRHCVRIIGGPRFGGQRLATVKACKNPKKQSNLLRLKLMSVIKLSP